MAHITFCTSFCLIYVYKMESFYFFSDIGPYGSKFSMEDVKKSMEQTGVGLKGMSVQSFLEMV